MLAVRHPETAREEGNGTTAGRLKPALFLPEVSRAPAFRPRARGQGDQAAKRRSRPCGSIQSIVGPIGTIRVGLIVSWLR